MTPYTIRPATAAAADTIKRLVRSAPLDPNAIDWHYFLVLEIIENEKPKIVSIGMAHPEGDAYEMDSVMTRPEYRKRGYAEAIVRALIERTPHPIYLLAEDDLIAYYEKFGFRVMTDDAPHDIAEKSRWVTQYVGVRYSVMGKTE
jgi:N-acetylglutamate synthase-like GNAT family acetyltransferase